jgi:hypothetical protein
MAKDRAFLILLKGLINAEASSKELSEIENYLKI